MGTAPSLDRRRFRDVTPDHAGDVGADTVFGYREEADGTVHARYEGGSVRLGFLVGARSGDELDFHYSHVTIGGELASGRCHSRIEVLDDGRLRLHETWQWTTQPGDGTSVVEEFRDGPLPGNDEAPGR